MSTYNPNDFYPRTGQEVKSDGTTANEADGINPDGSRNMVTTGRKTSQLLGHQALAIRDTTTHDIDVDVTSIPGMKVVVITNSTDQSVTLSLYAKATNYSFAGMGSGKSIASGATVIVSDVDCPSLKAPIQKITIRVAAATTPTTGSVSTFIEGTV